MYAWVSSHATQMLAKVGIERRKETESPALTATATPGMLYLGMEGVGPAASVVTRRTVSVTGGGAAAPSAGPVRA